MQAVVIAAGESKRFWPLNNGIHKAQFKLFGRSLMYWTLKGLAENGIKDVMIVVSKNSSIREMLEQENDVDINISYATQEEPLGSGNALWQAKDFIKDSFVLIWPSKINSGEIVREMLQLKEKEQADAVLAGAHTEYPERYGVVRFENEKPVEIVENPEQGKEPSDMRTIGAFLLEQDFFSFYEKVKRRESDFIDALNLYFREKRAALLQIEKDAPTLKYPWDLFGLMDIVFEGEHFKAGEGENVSIGKNVVLENEDKIYIGNNVKIQAGTVIEGPAYIGDDCVIGHSNVLRGPINLERGVKTGAFMEIKHSIVQKATHFHSGYLGDSVVGERCRFGAGFICANRRFDRRDVAVQVGDKKIDTGASYLGAFIGEKASFGIHSGTMPGVLVAPESVVMPGTHVMENKTS